jgi:hypothetical protein
MNPMSETAENLIATPRPALGKYRLRNALGDVITSDDKLDAIEEFCSTAIPDGTYTIDKVLRTVTISTPQPRARVQFTSLESRPRAQGERKPRAPKTPKK